MIRFLVTVHGMMNRVALTPVRIDKAVRRSTFPLFLCHEYTRAERLPAFAAFETFCSKTFV